MTLIRIFFPCLITMLLAACGPTPAEIFTEGRGFNPCLQVLPACPGQTAICVLDGATYTKTEFPREFSFIVPADPNSKIEVAMFFEREQDAGLNTIILWNEPGCSDVYSYESDGRNLFQESEDTSTFSVKKEVFEGGEHLIQIISDMQAHVILAVSVIAPGT